MGAKNMSKVVRLNREELKHTNEIDIKDYKV